MNHEEKKGWAKVYSFGQRKDQICGYLDEHGDLIIERAVMADAGFSVQLYPYDKADPRCRAGSKGAIVTTRGIRVGTWLGAGSERSAIRLGAGIGGVLLPGRYRLVAQAEPARAQAEPARAQAEPAQGDEARPPTFAEDDIPF